jgi:hypothetical protein
MHSPCKVCQFLPPCLPISKRELNETRWENYLSQLMKVHLGFASIARVISDTLTTAVIRCCAISVQNLTRKLFAPGLRQKTGFIEVIFASTRGRRHSLPKMQSGHAENAKTTISQEFKKELTGQVLPLPLRCSPLSFSKPVEDPQGEDPQAKAP